MRSSDLSYPMEGRESLLVTLTWQPPAASKSYCVRHQITIFDGVYVFVRANAIVTYIPGSHRFIVRVVGQCVVPVGKKVNTS